MVRILVVDDDANVRSAISRLTQASGRDRGTEAGDGNEAIRAYTEHPADQWFCCDIEDAGGRGPAKSSENWTSTFPDVRVVAMSGDGD